MRKVNSRPNRSTVIGRNHRETVAQLGTTIGQGSHFSGEEDGRDRHVSGPASTVHGGGVEMYPEVRSGPIAGRKRGLGFWSR